MRCPKCGYHSFDHLDSCKKCGGDLLEQKLRFKHQGYVAPVAGEEPVTVPVMTELSEEAEAESEAIDFGFDVLAEEGPQPELANEAVSPAAIDADAFDFAAASGLPLDQPFPAAGETLPDDELPKRDDRFDF